jgi:hypothetical protein
MAFSPYLYQISPTNIVQSLYLCFMKTVALICVTVKIKIFPHFLHFCSDLEKENCTKYFYKFSSSL